MGSVMEFEKMIKELFADEDRARDMARRLMEVAIRDARAAANERESVVAFLRGAMERHMAYEEREIFPHLVERGLAPEVQVAEKHHAAIRQAAETLDKGGPADHVAREVFNVARMMLHHTNFEGDYIYPELNVNEWRTLLTETAKG